MSAQKAASTPVDKLAEQLLLADKPNVTWATASRWQRDQYRGRARRHLNRGAVGRSVPPMAGMTSGE